MTIHTLRQVQIPGAVQVPVPLHALRGELVEGLSLLAHMWVFERAQQSYRQKQIYI